MKAGTESVVYSPRPVSSLRPHGLQHTRFPCPSLSPRACSDLCPVSWWCHQTVSSSVIPFSSCPHSWVWLYFNISLVLFPTAFRSFEDKNRVFPSARLDIRALPRLQRSASASKLSYKFLKLDYLPLVGDLHSIALLHLNGAISFFDTTPHCFYCITPYPWAKIGRKIWSMGGVLIPIYSANLKWLLTIL